MGSRKRLWRKKELILRLPLDRDDLAIDCYRMTWMDNRQCIEIRKMMRQRSTARLPFPRPLS